MLTLHRLRSGGMQPWLAAAALLFAAGCGGGDDAGDVDREFAPGEFNTFSGAPPGGSVVVIPDGEPDDLNPLTYSSSPAAAVTHLVFRTLARRDSTLGNYVPDLAQSWQLQPDSSTLLIKLRPDVRWHDNQPVTAEDVVFTIQRQMDEAVASPRQADVAAVDGIRAIDPTTVEVKMSKAGPYAVNALLEVMPVPKHLLESVAPDQLRFAEFGRSPVGNGLFRFGSWDKGQQLTLVANEDAPEGRPALDRIILRTIPDANAAMTEILSGNADVLKISPDQAERVQATPRVELAQAPKVRPAWLAWNVRKPPVNDPQVRRAILMGIDRDAVVQGLFPGVGEVATSPLPSRLKEHSGTVRPLTYNPGQAAQLLEAAGWRDTDNDGIREKNGRPLRLEVDYNSTDQVRADVLVALQAQLKKIGVDLVPKPFERTTWVSRLRNGEFVGSFWGWGWGPGVVGPNAEAVFHSRSIPAPNFAGYSNPRVDALVDSALVTFDPARSQQLWAQLEQQVIDDAVYAPIFLDPELYAVSERVGNVKFRGIEWWEDAPYWYIPPAARLPRDRAS